METTQVTAPAVLNTTALSVVLQVGDSRVEKLLLLVVVQHPLVGTVEMVVTHHRLVETMLA